MMVPSGNDKGIALIIVLGVVSLFTVLSGMLITSSKGAAIGSKITSERSRLKYAAESATAFTQWMVMTYNFNNPTRDQVQDDSEEETWFADGSEHQLELVDGVVGSVRVYDVNRGWNIGKLSSEKNDIVGRFTEDDDEMRDAIEEFFAVYQDYIDKDDLRRHPDFGMEIDDYKQAGLEGFPRNGNLNFREEMYWIKNVEILVPRLQQLQIGTALPDDLFRTPAPPGIRDSVANTAYSFWSAPMSWIESKVVGGISGSERELIRKCRSFGFVNEATIQECLGFELYGKLKGIRGLSFNPRNTTVFTIDTTVNLPGTGITRRMVSTMDLKNPPVHSGNSRVGAIRPLVYWQRIFY